jgi:hypothetical protein
VAQLLSNTGTAQALIAEDGTLAITMVNLPSPYVSYSTNRTKRRQGPTYKTLSSPLAAIVVSLQAVQTDQRWATEGKEGGWVGGGLGFY